MRDSRVPYWGLTISVAPETATGDAKGVTLTKVNLSQVVSKYLGETEKNLGTILNRADRIGFVLFFDEAGTLLGRRPEVKDHTDARIRRFLAAIKSTALSL